MQWIDEMFANMGKVKAAESAKKLVKPIIAGRAEH
jgi:hypothetical protein